MFTRAMRRISISEPDEENEFGTNEAFSFLNCSLLIQRAWQVNGWVDRANSVFLFILPYFESNFLQTLQPL
jgi:hypothetical protein